jgi:catechol 2,3-dioxygenase-like lactoylglutathione lyase family enzyme
VSIENALASVAVKDLDVAEDWYTRLLGLAGSRPMNEVVEWKLPGGGGLQVYALAERAGRGSFTLVVRDLEAEIRKLDAMGVDTRQRTSTAQVKTVMVTDPDGNHVALAEAWGQSTIR